MSLKPYPKYKDSGVEWLGEVPEHWDIARIKHTASLRTDRSTEAPVNSTYIGLEDVESGTGQYRPTEGSARQNEDSTVGVFKSGDVLYGKLRPYLKKAIVSDTNGVCSTEFLVLQPKTILAQWLHQWLLTTGVTQQIEAGCEGSKMPRADWEHVGSIHVPFPAALEQAEIIAVLDRETKSIDSLINTKSRFIELLKEKRQALISHAVTKGLNPNAPMKPSGIEWLGDVPAHWSILRIKNVSQFITSGPRGWSDNINEYGELFIQSGDIDDFLNVKLDLAKRVKVESDSEAERARLNNGDVIVCITGAKTGNVGVVMGLTESAYVNQHLCLIRPDSMVLSLFMGMYLKSANGQTYLDQSQYGLKQGLNLSAIREAPFPFPPLPEQQAIVAFLDAETAKLDQLGAQAQRAIQLLQERRAALISAAVTGKLDLRLSHSEVSA